LLTITMTLDMLINYLPSHTLSGPPGGVTVWPKFSGPKPLLDSRELTEQRPRTYVFYYANHLAYRGLFWKRHCTVHMFFRHFHFINPYTILFAYFLDQVFRSFPYLALFEDLFPVFWAPHQMLCLIAGRMTRPLQSHASFDNIAAQGPMWMRGGDFRSPL